MMAGGVIAYPTEGVWGLGCDPFDQRAVYRVLEMKVRPVSKGLILVADNLNRFDDAIAGLSKDELELLGRDNGYPLTWLIPNNETFPDWISGGADTLAIRVSSHPLVRQLCERYGSAIVSTSANPAGRPAAKNALRVRQYFNRELDFLLPGRVQYDSGASEIRHLRSGRIVRPKGS